MQSSRCLLVGRFPSHSVGALMLPFRCTETGNQQTDFLTSAYYSSDYKQPDLGGGGTRRPPPLFLQTDLFSDLVFPALTLDLGFWSQMPGKRCFGTLDFLFSGGGPQPRSKITPPSGVPRGGRGGYGPRAQALEGAPAQLVGANFKRWGEFQPSKSSFFFCLSIFSPGGNANSGGGADASIGPRALETLGTPLTPPPPHFPKFLEPPLIHGYNYS